MGVIRKLTLCENPPLLIEIGFGPVLMLLDSTKDERVMEFRNELVMAVQEVNILLRQDRKDTAIPGLADLVRTLGSKIDTHGDLDRDGMPTPWELEKRLDPKEDAADEDAENRGKTNQGELTDPEQPDQVQNAEETQG